MARLATGHSEGKYCTGNYKSAGKEIRICHRRKISRPLLPVEKLLITFCPHKHPGKITKCMHLGFLYSDLILSRPPDLILNLPFYIQFQNMARFFQGTIPFPAEPFPWA